MNMFEKKINTVIVGVLSLLPFISVGQTQKPSEKDKQVGLLTYFTVINSQYISYTNPEIKIEEIDLSHVTPIYAQKYFQDILFYSAKAPTQILFEIFVTINKEIRKKEFFTNHESLSIYFQNKYNISFFYDAVHEKNLEFKNSFGYLERLITYDDFEKIIFDNLIIDLIKTSNITQSTKNAPFTLVYNWDFFEELVLYPNMNLLLKTVHSLPVGKTLHSDKKKNLQIAALSNLDVWSYVTDSRIKGLMFYESDFKRYKCGDLKLPFCNCFKINIGYRVEPYTRNFEGIYKTHYQSNEAKFSRDYQMMLDFFAQKLLPFKILENKSTK